MRDRAEQHAALLQHKEHTAEVEARLRSGMEGRVSRAEGAAHLATAMANGAAERQAAAEAARLRQAARPPELKKTVFYVNVNTGEQTKEAPAVWTEGAESALAESNAAGAEWDAAGRRLAAQFAGGVGSAAASQGGMADAQRVLVAIPPHLLNARLQRQNKLKAMGAVGHLLVNVDEARLWALRSLREYRAYRALEEGGLRLRRGAARSRVGREVHKALVRGREYVEI